MVAAQLTRVDHRHAGHNIAERLEQRHCITHTFLLGSVPTILIVVGDKVHTDGLRTDRRISLGEVSPYIFYALFALRHFVHHVMQAPAVVHIERTLGQLLRFVFIFGEREHMRIGLTQVTHRPVPEVGRHFARYVAAETINTDRVHPPVHGFEHRLTHVLVLVVQFGDIRPVVLHHQVAQAVTIVPSFVLCPLAVRRRMVSHPVEDHFKALLVGSGEEMLEVRARTELGVDSAVVDDRVITAQRSLTGDLTDRLARHDPDNVDTVFA